MTGYWLAKTHVDLALLALDLRNGKALVLLEHLHSVETTG